MDDAVENAPPTGSSRRTRKPGTRFGYLVSAAINAGLVYVVHHLLEWGWPNFLTDEFDELLPIVTVSLVASMVANLAFIVHDGPGFKSFANAITSGIAFVVALRTLQVFPFDFSSYSRDWSGLVRVVLVVAMIGTGIACVAETVRFLSAPFRRRAADA